MVVCSFSQCGSVDFSPADIELVSSQRVQMLVFQYVTAGSCLVAPFHLATSITTSASVSISSLPEPFSEAIKAISEANAQLPLSDEQTLLAIGVSTVAYGLFASVNSKLPEPAPELLEGTILEGRQLRRVYKASTDGWSAVDFHKKVDFAGPCIVLAATGSSIFGGFNPRGWASTDDYLSSNNAFVFARDGKVQPVCHDIYTLSTVEEEGELHPSVR